MEPPCVGIHRVKASVHSVLEFKPRLRGSRGHGPKPAEACCPTAMAWQGDRKPSPYIASACCSLHLRWTVDVGPKAVRGGTLPPRYLAPLTMRFRWRAWAPQAARRQRLSYLAKVWKKDLVKNMFGKTFDLLGEIVLDVFVMLFGRCFVLFLKKVF